MYSLLSFNKTIQSLITFLLIFQCLIFLCFYLYIFLNFYSIFLFIFILFLISLLFVVPITFLILVPSSFVNLLFSTLFNLLLWLFFVPVCTMRQPSRKHFLFDFMLNYFCLEISSVFPYSFFFVFSELYFFPCISTFVIRFECHSIQIQSLTWSKVYIKLLWVECSFYCLLSFKVFRKNFNQKTNHFTNLMINKWLTN